MSIATVVAIAMHVWLRTMKVLPLTKHIAAPSKVAM